jgi:hypothetical protein
MISSFRRLLIRELHISIYVSDGIEQNGLPFGRHKRVYIYQEVPDWVSTYSAWEIWNLTHHQCPTLLIPSVGQSLNLVARDTAYLDLRQRRH